MLGLIPPPPGVFRKDINPWELLTNFSQGYHSKRLLDAHDDSASKYAYGFSIALDPVLCRAGLNESSAVGFRIVSDALLFYRMVQGHFRQLRFWAWYGSTSGHASFEFREDDTDKSPALPKQTAKDGAPRRSESEAGPPIPRGRGRAPEG